MTRRRKWAVVVPSFLAVGALVAGLAAYSGAQANAPGADRPHSERLNTKDTVWKGVALDAPHGPWGYSGASSGQGYSPAQPVAFPHPLHVQKLGMNCVYCHFAANKSMDPGMPAVSTCMGCHTVVATQKPEIKRLAAYWNKKQPVPWVRIHKVPEYVHFPHMRHVNAGVTCQTCHGQVQKMNQVYQYASLNMGWCVDCHVNGYDPKAGDKAAGYTAAPGGGYKLANASAGGAASLGVSLVREANAQTTTPPAAPGQATQPTAANPMVPGGASLTGPRKRARYDCSVCHY
jgi:hypothetical protein